MSFNGLRLEYAHDGSSNYIAWKDRMEAVLENNGLKEFINSDVPKLGSSDAASLDILVLGIGNNSVPWLPYNE